MLRYITIFKKERCWDIGTLKLPFVMPIIRDYTYLTLKMTNLDLETLTLFKGDISIMFRSNIKLMLPTTSWEQKNCHVVPQAI
jgi:hypothetical protein